MKKRTPQQESITRYCDHCIRTLPTRDTPTPSEPVFGCKVSMYSNQAVPNLFLVPMTLTREPLDFQDFEKRLRHGISFETEYAVSENRLCYRLAAVFRTVSGSG